MSAYQQFELEGGRVVNIQGRMLKKLDAIPLPDLKGKRVLDIGCDFGFWSFLAAERGAAVLGLDRNRDGMNLIRRNNGLAQEHHLPCKFEYLNLGKQWHEFGRFDVVLMFSLYHHVFENCGSHEAVWHWLRRHVADDGVLLWENPLTADDAVVRMNVSESNREHYTREKILAAAGRYFNAEYVGPALHEATREVWRFTPKPLERFAYQGGAVAGAGGASKAFEYDHGRRIREFREILGVDVLPGSLNVRCLSDFDWNTGYFRAQVLDVVDRKAGLESEWAPKWARFYPVKANGVQAWAFRFEGERYPARFLELVSPVKLRDHVTDAVEIEVEGVDQLTIACVQVGNYCGRGKEYVRTLHYMVERNLGLPHRFVCYTDSPIPGIECRPVPEGLKGWWAKLWLFHELKGRVLYLDLDTCITGPLEPFTTYQGQFAALRDFYREDGLGSGMMIWNGDHSRIWDEWVRMGQPRLPGGDQAWIEKFEADRIQDLYPGLVASYKRDSLDAIPSGANVVCFHGHPRPHEVTEGWVKDCWKVGGIVQPRFVQGLNTSPKIMLEQAEANLKRDLPMFIGRAAHKGVALIVGGGPSLADTLPDLQRHKQRGGKVFALNGTHDWLIDHGIVPDYHVILDAREDNTRFVQHPRKEVTYLIAAQAHPAVLDALQGFNVVLWLGWMDGANDLARRHSDKPMVVVGGGNTVGLKAMMLAYLDGFRKIRLFGFDSSYRGDANHAYRQELNDGEATIEIIAAGRKFKCARWMARQAIDFQNQARTLAGNGVDIRVHGDGLIPWIARQWDKQEAA